MYALYAEDTSSPDRAFVLIRTLTSKRFSRAMREARLEVDPYTHCRLFVAPESSRHHDIPDGDRAYTDTPPKPAPVGSPANQALQRATLVRQVPLPPRTVEWDSPQSPTTEKIRTNRYPSRY